MEFIVGYFHTGKVIPKTQVTKGLPPSARLIHVSSGKRVTWFFLFEGKPEEGPDAEGAIQDVRVEFTTIHGDFPLLIPERKEEGD